jgi:hypothetical protein
MSLNSYSIYSPFYLFYSMKRFLQLMIIFSLPISIFAQNWTVEPVDSMGDVFDCSIVVDNQNYPHIAYCYRHPLGGNFYSYWLKYTRWNGITWEFQPAESISAFNLGIPIFKFAKLCIDNQNHPHIAYCKDSVQFKYAYYDGDSWQILLIDSVINLRYYNIPRNCINMALSEAGIPHISYSFIDFNASIRGIRYAFKNGDSWIIQTVWEENRIPNSILFTTAIDFDISGYPVIAFSQWSYSTSDTGHLFCARFNGQNWEIDTVQNMENEMYYVFSIKVNSPDRIHIFYKRDFGIFHAETTGDSWAIKFIDMNGLFEAGGDMILDGDKPNVLYSSIEDPLIYAYKVDTVWHYEIIDFGLYPSLAKDNDGVMHVCYQVEYYLFYARRNIQAITEKQAWSIAESKAIIKIYPNPAKLYFTIRLPQTADRKEIKIFDVSGKLIKEIASPPKADRNDSEMIISLKGINPGIYFLRFGKETKKFLVIK